MTEEFNRGDPQGRRLARMRAGLLSEATNVARVLSVLLKRANIDTAICDELLAQLNREETKQLQISYGRIGSRGRFKHNSSQPILQRRPINHIFLDESGISNPEPLPGPRVFALGAVAMDGESVEKYCLGADEIKQEFFGTKSITFHEPNMRNYSGPYNFDGDLERQQAFEYALESLLKGIDFTVFGVGIRKDAFAKEFLDTGLDPYLPTDVYSVAIVLLLERYVDFLNTIPVQHMGRATFESIGSKEDALHQLEYARVLIEGSQWVPDSAFRNYLETGLRFHPKQGSSPLELSDMFCRDLYEWVRSDCSVSPKRWDLFGQKIYCRGDGLMGKFGVKVFPDTDLRAPVEERRRKYGAVLG